MFVLSKVSPFMRHGPFAGPLRLLTIMSCRFSLEPIRDVVIHINPHQTASAVRNLYPKFAANRIQEGNPKSLKTGVKFAWMNLSMPTLYLGLKVPKPCLGSSLHASHITSHQIPRRLASHINTSWVLRVQSVTYESGLDF